MFLLILILYFIVTIAQRDMMNVAMANNALRQITIDKDLFDTRSIPFRPFLYEAKVMNKNLFKLDPRYSEFDKNGVPTKMADGNVISEENRNLLRNQMKETLHTGKNVYDSFYNWLELLLTNHIFKTPPQTVTVNGDAKNITVFNSYLDLLGGVLMVQRASSKYSCESSLYSSSRTCFKKDSFIEDKILPGTEMSTNVHYSDKLDGYPIIFKSGTEKVDVMDQIQGYRQQYHSYISNATRSIAMSIPVFAHNINVIGMLELDLRFDVAGFWSVSPHELTMPYKLYTTGWQKFRLFCEFVLVGLYVPYTYYAVVNAMVRAKLLSGGGQPPLVFSQPPLNSFGSAASIVSICLTWASFIVYCVILGWTNGALQKLDVDNVADIVIDINWILDIWDFYATLGVLNGVLLTLHLFQYLHFQPRVASIVAVISAAMSAFASFLVVIKIVVLGFSFSFLLLFGSQFPYLSSYHSIVTHLLANIVGTWKPDDLELSASHAWLAYVIYFAFNVFMLLLLLKMATAIVVESYRQTFDIQPTQVRGIAADFVILWTRLKLLTSQCCSSRDYQMSLAQVETLLSNPAVSQNDVMSFAELRDAIADTMGELDPQSAACFVLEHYGSNIQEARGEQSGAKSNSGDLLFAKKTLDSLSNEDLSAVVAVLRGFERRP